MNEVGELIRQYRREKNLSQQDLSDGICSRSHLSHVERGNRYPGPVVLARLADRLGVPLTEFLDDYLKRAAISAREYMDLSRELSRTAHYDLAREVMEIPTRYIEHQVTAAETRYRFRREYLDALGYWHFRQADYAEALDTYQDYLEYCSLRPSNTFYLARAHFLVGNTTIRKRQYQQAKESLLLAFGHVISISPEGTDVESSRVVQLHEKVLQAMLHVLVRLKDHAVGRHFYHMAKLRWQEMDILNEPHPSILLNAGLCLLGTDQIGQSKRLFDRLRASAPEPPYDRLCLHNLGFIHRVEGNLHRALGVLREAWDLYQDQGGWDGRAVANEIARCYLALGDHQETEKWLNVADGTEEKYVFEPNPDSMAQTLVIRQRLMRDRDDEEDVDYLEKAGALELSEEGRWGVSFERLRDLIKQNASFDESISELEALKQLLPGMFLS